LRRGGFAGEIFLVNPNRRSIDGMPVYPDVASLPRTPDLAVVTTPPAAVPGLVGALGARGTRAAVVIAAGFGELGDTGRRLQQAMLDAAQPHLLRLLGPNCVGVIVPRLGLDASFSHLAPPPGGIALVSQSGAMATAMLDWAAPRGIGFSHVVSVGDMADIDFGDMLDYLAADPGTRTILLYAEGITHGRKFMSAARAAARSKPVLVLKAGRSVSGARAAASHTGMLAGSNAVYDAAFHRAGTLRVSTMAELFDAVETLALTREQFGERLAIVTNGGGAGVLAVDALEAAGGRLAALAPDTIGRLGQVLPATWSRGNPVDIIGDASGERYSAALEVLFADPGIDAFLVLHCPTALTEPEQVAQAVVERAVAGRLALRGRNIFTAWLGEHSAAAARRRFSAAGIPTYETPEAGVSAFLHRVKYQRNRALLMETPPTRPDAFEPDIGAVRQLIAAALARGVEWLVAEEIAVVLGAYGIPEPPARIARDPEQAATAAAAIGFPVALKIRSPDIVHKTDLGGVVLNLQDQASVEAAARELLSTIRAASPDARIDGFLVQQMTILPDAIELLIGIAEDPVFGPVIVFGRGGTAVEIVRDTAIGLPPLNTLLARSQMEQTQVYRLLQGYRGTPPVAVDAVADALIRVAQLAADHPEIRELDINPLLADAAGIVALDARIRIAPSAATGAARLAIAPYPKDLARVMELRGGGTIELRPVLPEDEPLVIDLTAHMSLEDLRLRFFAPIRGLTHALAARLTQIDYDREMALVALQNGVALGIAHFFSDPDRERAEYAVAVRTDRKGQGIGYVLMTRLIDIAGQFGIGELVGEVLRDNERMLGMCRHLGFSVASDPEDAAVMRVTKRLDAATAA
jgi:acetyltransferase